MTLSMMTPHGSQGVKKRGPRARPGAPRARPRALVTGGAIRVGRAIALALARAGMDVAIGYHRSARQAASTVGEIEACGVRGVALRTDLADPRGARRRAPPRRVSPLTLEGRHPRPRRRPPRRGRRRPLLRHLPPQRHRPDPERRLGRYRPMARRNWPSDVNCMKGLRRFSLPMVDDGPP